MAERSNLNQSVNALAQAAAGANAIGGSTSASTDASADPLVEMPPLPQLPTPQKAASTPTGDHGQSNIVFSDADTDASFVR